MEKAVLAFTDGCTLHQTVFPSYEEAKAMMDKLYNKYYDVEKDINGDSYLGKYNAKVVNTYEEVLLWNIVKTESIETSSLALLLGFDDNNKT